MKEWMQRTSARRGLRPKRLRFKRRLLRRISRPGRKTGKKELSLGETSATKNQELKRRKRPISGSRRPQSSKKRDQNMRRFKLTLKVNLLELMMIIRNYGDE